MSRIVRQGSLLRKVARGLRNVPAAVRCIVRFKNWRRIVCVYAGAEEFAGPFDAIGRRSFVVHMTEVTDVQTLWMIFCREEYRVPRGVQTVVDLGANIGAFSLYALVIRGVDRVIALEPVGGTFEKLSGNIRSNGMREKVALVKKGIGGKNGWRTIDLGVASAHACMFPRESGTLESGTSECIDVITLCAMFEELGLVEVDMCKMDCEGGEVEAILSAPSSTLRRIRQLSIEYHFPNDLSTEDALFGKLREAGFRLERHDRLGHLASFIRVE